MGSSQDWDDYYEGMNSDESKTSRALADMAEEWYSSITREEVKTRMMVNYITGITDNMTREEARDMLREEGVIDG